MAIDLPIKGAPAKSAPAVGEPASPAPRPRLPQTTGVERFEATDDLIDLTKIPVIGRLLKKRFFQFFAILPNQIIFWFVIIIGIFGIAEPTKNFATAITWYLWFTVDR